MSRTLLPSSLLPLFALIVTMPGSTQASSDDLRGVVTDQAGKPIAKAYVKGARASEWVRTDSAGRYHLTKQGQLISFRAPGYRPLTRFVSWDANVLDVVLEKGETTEWKITYCGQLVGTVSIWAPHSRFRIKVSGASGAISESDEDDAGGISVPFRADGKVYLLVAVDGFYNTHGNPEPRIYRDATQIEERAFTLPYSREGSKESIFPEGLDARGRDKAGRRWRWVGTSGGSMAITYEGVPDVAARAFDSMVDSLCVVRHIPKP